VHIRRSGSISTSPPASPRWGLPNSPSRCCHGSAPCWCFLVMVTYIPEIALWLPRALGMLN